MKAKRVNLAGIALVVHFESFQPNAYRDSGGVLTIGYGHTSTVQENDVIDMYTARELLRKDMKVAEDMVNSAVKVPLTNNQFGALVAFTFNVGITAFSKSTMLKKLNNGDYDGAAAEFEKWTKVNGTELKGLVKRRAAERQLFVTPDNQEVASND